MAKINLFEEVGATGVFSGFDAIIAGSILNITQGHARLHGDLIPGGWHLDISNLSSGWWSIIAGPTEASITQDFNTQGLPLWALLVEDGGVVVTGRDLRRRCLGIIWEAGKPCTAALPVDAPLVFRRLQAATCEIDGAGVPYWTKCIVRANLHYGQVITSGTVLELEADRTTGGKIGCILEGLDTGA